MLCFRHCLSPMSNYVLCENLSFWSTRTLLLNFSHCFFFSLRFFVLLCKSASCCVWCTWCTTVWLAPLCRCVDGTNVLFSVFSLFKFELLFYFRLPFYQFKKIFFYVLFYQNLQKNELIHRLHVWIICLWGHQKWRHSTFCFVIFNLFMFYDLPWRVFWRFYFFQQIYYILFLPMFRHFFLLVFFVMKGDIIMSSDCRVTPVTWNVS